MRPDEHKQKKNTQYKKKHGISSKKQEKTEDSGKDGKKFKDTKQGKSGPKQPPAARTYRDDENEDKRLNRPEASAHDDRIKGGDDEGQAKVFKRRELVNNWEKYELPVESEPELRGKDFSEALAEAGDSLSQFRFQDEKDFNESLEDGGGASDLPKFLSINMVDLTGAIKSVPIHERLGLDTGLFDESTLQLMNDEAKMYAPSTQGAILNNTPEQSYTTNDNIEPNEEDKANSEHEKSDDTIINDTHTAESLPSIANEDADTKAHVDSKNDSKGLTVIDNELMDLLDNTNQDSSSTKLPQTMNAAPKSNNLKSMDDDLDVLLGITPSSTSKPGLNHGSGLQEQFENRTGAELSKTNDVLEIETKVTELQVEPVVKGVGEKSDNLEDWLDSMLDD
ncbi:unnamed protein product [Owenia fusiformis]|uniref:Uncharacterized protein n=1 Tax=Owenia fusiformis TaxID=6347 RepID=A0A8J1U2Y5_OWEFU|nr:unnamed protein product [Owenia fusiformis]